MLFTLNLWSKFRKMLAMLTLFLGNMGAGEIILIFSVILIFFGAKRIPELARGLGKGIREFKDASAGIKREIEDASNVPAEKKEQN